MPQAVLKNKPAVRAVVGENLVYQKKFVADSAFATSASLAHRQDVEAPASAMVGASRPPKYTGKGT